MDYPIDLIIKYETTTEYRISLRNLFKMNPKNYIINTEPDYDITSIDDETRDELSYDETAASGIMNYIYEKTRAHPLFQKLYELSAGLMFSTDNEIGLSVLLSYDYLADFHNCLVVFMKTPELFSRETECYYSLLKRLSR